jgi:hypothetical protein
MSEPDYTAALQAVSRPQSNDGQDEADTSTLRMAYEARRYTLQREAPITRDNGTNKDVRAVVRSEKAA